VVKCSCEYIDFSGLSRPQLTGVFSDLFMYNSDSMRLASYTWQCVNQTQHAEAVSHYVALLFGSSATKSGLSVNPYKTETVVVGIIARQRIEGATISVDSGGFSLIPSLSERRLGVVIDDMASSDE
jgi:hypothetical protein